MSIQHLNPHIWFAFIFCAILLSCSSDGSNNLRNSFKCCTEEIDGNVNNLPLQENGELVDIVVSNLITPNGDGINDFWVVENLHLYPNNKVEIYDSNNQLIFSAEGYALTDSVFPNIDIAQGSYRYRIVIEREDVFLRQGYLCAITEFPNSFKPSLGCSTLYPDPLLP